jgi:hypothetical protein
MNEVVIRYKNKKVLEVLRDFAKYFEFTIVTSGIESEKKSKSLINGVTIIEGDSSVDASELKDIFTGREFDSIKVRKDLWERSK